MELRKYVYKFTMVENNNNGGLLVDHFLSLYPLFLVLRLPHPAIIECIITNLYCLS